MKHLELRALVYGDLAILFHKPGPKLAALFSGDGLPARTDAYRELRLNPDPLIEAAAEYRNGDGLDKALLPLNREYTRLFVTAYPRVPVQPYGSIHMEGSDKLWGETTRDVVKIYSRAGLRISEDFQDIPDHFAVELEFMFYLKRARLALAAPDGRPEGMVVPEHLTDEELIDIEREFLSRHLLKWGPGFVSEVATESRLPFYRELAVLTGTFLELESNRLKSGSDYEQIV